GSSFNVTVTALDASNAVVTGYTGTVHFTSSSAGTLPADATLTNGTGTFSATLTTTGAQTVTATDTATASITGSASITVNAAPQVATHFSVSAPASVTAGTSFNVAVTALDASNAVVTGYTGTVHFTSSSAGTLPADATLTNGTGTFSVTLTTTGAQTVTATDTATASINGSASITVNAAPQVATHFSVNAPASVTAGTSFNVAVTALDASNAVVTGYTGTVHFTSSSAGTLPGDATLTNGTGTFSATLTTTGAQSVTATDTATTSISGSANITVNAAPQVATHFSVSAPANVAAGTPFSVTVTALDASNAVVTGYTGTVHFTSSSAGTLPADATLTNGTRTFSVTLTTTGAQTLTAGDGSINGSANITVAAPPQVATHFSVTAPANVTAGTPFNVTVTALDASNAVVTGYTGTVHFTSSSAGTLPADATLTNGTRTFSVTLTTTGGQTLTAGDGSINGSANINVVAPPQVATHFSVNAPANVTAGTPFNVTVTALDASNAVVTGYTGTVHFTSSSAGTLPADATLTNGTRTFSVTLTTTGAQTLTAGDGSINGSANIIVAAPPQVATHFSVNAPANVTAGTPFNVTVTALDASNAVVTGYTGTVHFTSSSAGTLPADATLTNGTRTFSVTLTTTGAQTLTAGDGSINGSANITVAAPPQVATHFSVTAPANVTAGTPFNVTVTALDASNAVVTGYTGTVHFTSSSAGTLPADATLTNGTRTFSVTLTTKGAQTLTAGDGSINGSANITVAAPPQVATHFSVNAPANVTAGTPFNVTVTALDASNAVVTGYTGTVHFTSSSAGTLPADATLTNGIGTFSVTLTTSGAQTLTAADGTITGSANIAVAQVATHFSVTTPATVTVGTPFSITVTALDDSNAVVPSYAGTVHFTSTGAATLPSDATLTNGTRNFTVTFTASGTQTITAGDGTISGAAIVSAGCAPAVTATITTPSMVCARSSRNTASVSIAGATGYQWTITNGTITAGQGTSSITYTAGTNRSVTIAVAATGSTGCAIATGSATVTIAPRPTATLTAPEFFCPGAPVTVTATLTGGAPFTIYWSDGFVQTSPTNVATRELTLTATTSLYIDGVRSATSCTSGGSSNSVTITLGGVPQIVTQPAVVTQIQSGQTATLSVVTSSANVAYAWYEGISGDTSHPTGVHSATFVTPALTHAAHYWVRITSPCGEVDSHTAQVVIVGSKRRASSH
ncbi:MAG: hypothetical protein M3Q69_02610, partial [Acidobacteriota bacterium]|nr:hypothetical protein [Acidobacteriota bacterium]